MDENIESRRFKNYRCTVRRYVTDLREQSEAKYTAYIAFGIGVCLLLIIAIGLVIMSGKSNEVCETDICNELANELYSNLDTNVDPCKDFYAFACGGWPQKYPRPDNAQRWDAIERMRRQIMPRVTALLDNNEWKSPEMRQASKLYKSCINVEKRDKLGIQGLRSLFRKSGGFPLIDPSVDIRNYDVLTALVETFSLRNFPIFFDFQIWTQNGQLKIMLRQVSDFTAEYIFQSNRSESARIERLTRSDIKAAAKAMNPDLNARTLELQVDDVISFMLQLGNLTLNLQNLTEVIASRSNLSKYSNFLELDRFIVESFSKYDLEVPKNTSIILSSNAKYFNELGNLMKETPKTTIANYIGALMLTRVGVHLVEKIHTAVKGKSRTTEEIQRDCYSHAEREFASALRKEYVETYLSEQTRVELKEFFKLIKFAMTMVIQSNDWMDDETKLNAQLKLNKLVDETLQPGKRNNSTNDNLEMFDEENFFENIVKIARNKALIKLKGNYKYEYIRQSSPSTVNAFHYPSSNLIEIALGYFQQPVYYHNAPILINFATLASVIGHEITHAFDNRNIKYDEVGKRRNWWANESRAEFEKRVQCFVEQYSNFTEPTTGLKLNGARTLGDDIADNGGLRQAYVAFKLYSKLNKSEESLRLPGQMKSFSSDQLFFIAHATPFCTNSDPKWMKTFLSNNAHSPRNARLVIPTRNMEQFAKAFQCPPGSPMNPVKKCYLW